jgi:hypothetical protein
MSLSTLDVGRADTPVGRNTKTTRATLNADAVQTIDTSQSHQYMRRHILLTNEDSEGDRGSENNVLDLQASHTSRTVNSIYAIATTNQPEIMKNRLLEV